MIKATKDIQTSMNPLPETFGKEHWKLRYWSSSCSLVLAPSIKSLKVPCTRYFPSRAQSNLISTNSKIIYQSCSKSNKKIILDQ